MRVRNGTAMLAARPRDAHTTAALFLTLLLIGLTGSSFVGLAAADLPRLRDNLDGTRTITWRMNTTEGLTLQGVELVNGNATLPWLHSNITWSSPSQFAANALSATNLSYDASGISLRPDSSNHISDGNFSTGPPWSFEPSPGGNLTASWDQANESGRFSHDSAPTTLVWDSMDSDGPWVGVGGMDRTNGTGSHDGSGMVGLDFSLPASPDSFAGIQHQLAVNWSAYDRMLVWVLPLNVSSPLTFNVTAFVGATLHQTTAQSLSEGWQELVVNLTELGPARDSLVSLTLRVNGQNVPSTTVYFDDVRVGNAKRFDETGRLHQSILKQKVTSSAPGSGVLRFNWSLPNASGVVRVGGFVNLSGPSGSFERAFGGSPGSGWNPFEADVSGTTAVQGTYDLSFRVEVAADNTSASTVDVRLDDVSLVFPDRHNGTFLSKAVGPGLASEYLRVDWGIEAGGPSSVQMALRSGNNTNPGTSTWSAWEPWATPGIHPVTIPGARYVQVRVDLNTTNASVSPILRTMDLETRHRAPQGSIVSSVFTVPAEDRPLLRWQALRAVWSGSSGSSVSFSVGDVSYWQQVSSDGDLSSFTLTSIRWNATLSTTNGLGAPNLERVELVYDVLPSGGGGGWFAGIPYLPYALAVLVASVLGYAGYEFVIRRMFAIDDIFLISKDGRLMLHNTRRMRADRDEDILSAMLTAILTFLRDFDPEENGELRRFDIGGKTALLERGAHVFLAAVYSGRVPRWAGKDLRRFMSNLETRFGPTFARWTGSPEDLQGLKEFSEKFVSRVRYRPGRGARRQAG